MIRPAWSATRRQIRSRCSPLTDSAVTTSPAYAPASQPGSPVLMTTQARAAPRAATSASGMATAAATAPEVGRCLAGTPAGTPIGACPEGAAGADAGPPRGTRPGPAARGGPCTCWDTLGDILTVLAGTSACPRETRTGRSPGPAAQARSPVWEHTHRPAPTATAARRVDEPASRRPTVRAAWSAPYTKRMTGPNVGATPGPTTKSPGALVW